MSECTKIAMEIGKCIGFFVLMILFAIIMSTFFPRQETIDVQPLTDADRAIEVPTNE